jgi:hypothetical protein
LSGRGLCDGLITRPEESYRRNLKNEAAKTRKWVVKASKRRRINLIILNACVVTLDEMFHVIVKTCRGELGRK